MMENANDQQHTWTTSQVKKSMESLSLTIPDNVTHGDVTYPTTSHEATGLYQYIDNHIKNFDLSWQILD